MNTNMNTNKKRYSFLLVAIVALFTSVTTFSVFAAESSGSAAIKAALMAEDRFAGDAEQDEWRQTEVVLTFMGVNKGMRVLDYFAGGGYGSEALSRIVGPTGSVIVYNNLEYAGFGKQQMEERFANQRLANTEIVTDPTGDLKLTPNSLDGVISVLSYHDVYWTPDGATKPMGDPAKVTAILFDAVKPGGVVVIVDHVATTMDAHDSVDKMHRINPEVVKTDFTKAGFVFDSESDALKNATDDHSKGVFDPAIRHKTDRFILKFRKP